ncbi:MAG: MarR family transcriptional regulator, transcriptional regulator for hemolysin [Thermoleophilaceae bacterium]|nr:MarR family transcriptional regulator, transcriptional regulator for hemolysin [Thermoleophilaceae bacterium]
MAVAVKAPPADESLSENLCWLLVRASQSLNVELTAALAELGVSPRAHCVLATASTGEYTQTALAQAVGLDKTTMVVTLDELEAAGLAERRPAAGDRRARMVAVTKAGDRKVAQGRKIVARIQAEVLESLPAREREQFVGALARLVGERLAEPSPCAASVRRR